jgi:hypothetical protein
MAVRQVSSPWRMVSSFVLRGVSADLDANEREPNRRFSNSQRGIVVRRNLA